MTNYIRRVYLIELTNKNLSQRIAMRNALYHLGANEILPILYWVALTNAERDRLRRRFGGQFRPQ